MHWQNIKYTVTVDYRKKYAVSNFHVPVLKEIVTTKLAGSLKCNRWRSHQVAESSIRKLTCWHSASPSQPWDGGPADTCTPSPPQGLLSLPRTVPSTPRHTGTWVEQTSFIFSSALGNQISQLKVCPKLYEYSTSLIYTLRSF